MQLKMESSELEFQELVEKRKKEIKIQVDKKIDKIRFWYVIVELLVTTWWLCHDLVLCQLANSCGYMVGSMGEQHGTAKKYSQRKKFLERNLEVLIIFTTFVLCQR